MTGPYSRPSSRERSRDEYADKYIPAADRPAAPSGGHRHVEHRSGRLGLDRPTPPLFPPVMQELSTQLRTHCVGRYLIDLPKDLGSPGLSLATFYFGVTSEFETVEIAMPQEERMTGEAFWKAAYHRRDELLDNHNEAAGASMLMAQRLIDTPNGKALLLRRMENEIRDPTSVISELHAYVGGRHVILKIQSYAPEEKMLTHLNHIYLLADPVPTEELLIRVAQGMHPVDPARRALPNFCINGVMFNQKSIGYSEEKAFFDFQTNNGNSPSLSLEVSMNGRWGYGDETLFERINELFVGSFTFLKEMNIREIRRTHRTIEGVSFQEWGGEIYMKDKRATHYAFQIQNQKPRNPEDQVFERPRINVTAKSGNWSGNDNYSPYTLLQVESLWDQAISSLRLSPANGGTRP